MYCGTMKGKFSLVYRYEANITASEMATDKSLKMTGRVDFRSTQRNSQACLHPSGPLLSPLSRRPPAVRTKCQLVLDEVEKEPYFVSRL